MSSVELCTVEYGSPEYHSEIDLRYRVLREPLGLQFSESQLEAESTDIHLVARLHGNVVGTLVLTPKKEQTVQMRQFAVEPVLQKQGIGTQLVEYAEQIARERGFERITLHARDAAVRFYLRLGYQLIGDPFVEVTIPHREMEKAIRP